MNGDRMVIRRKLAANFVLDEHNVTRKIEACADHGDYTGLIAPECNCMPCWAFWYSTGLAITDNKIDEVKE
jgi:hypothetical protein